MKCIFTLYYAYINNCENFELLKLENHFLLLNAKQTAHTRSSLLKNATQIVSIHRRRQSRPVAHNIIAPISRFPQWYSMFITIIIHRICYLNSPSFSFFKNDLFYRFKGRFPSKIFNWKYAIFITVYLKRTFNHWLNAFSIQA